MDLPDLSLTWIISLSATVLLLTYFWFSRRNPKYPPCPLRPWPIVGNLLQLNPDPREQLVGFRKQCGDIYSLHMGPKLMIVLNGLDVLKEAFVKQGDVFSDRATIFLDVASDGVNRGISASNGAVWKEHRHFSVSMMKNFGLGTNILAGRIQEQVDHYMNLLENFQGEATDVRSITSISVSTIVCAAVVGHRYDHDDKEFQRLKGLVEFNFSKMKSTAIVNYFPWLRFLPGDLFFCKIIENNFREFYDIFVGSHIKENEDVDCEPENFIAAYLQEMKKKSISGEVTNMDRPNLLRLILDMFLGGTETVTTSLMWIFLYMVNYPDVQEKIWQEIKKVVGLNRAPGMRDRVELVYLTATIMEIQRLVCILPLSVPRVVLRDVDLQGYFIPRGSEIVMNFESVMRDPSVWGDDAEMFRPERFIADNGGIITPDAWIPFSIGRRACMGEGMAKMELFLFISNILQRFLILPEDPSVLPSVKGFFGITQTPFPYRIRFVNRT